MKKGIFIGVGVVAAAVCVALAALATGCTEKLIKLEEQVAGMKEEFVPMRFEIAEKNSSEIKLKAVMYDCYDESKKIGNMKTFDLEGEELFVDFQVIEFSNKNYIFFPAGLYTDNMSIDESVKLYDMYEKDSFPEIYGELLKTKTLDKTGLTPEDEESLRKEFVNLFSMVRSGQQASDREQHGLSVHDIKSVSQFTEGSVYKVICHPRTGGIEIVKE